MNISLYLLETPIGLALFKKNNQNFYLFDKLLYKDSDDAIENILSIKNLNFTKNLNLFFNKYKNCKIFTLSCDLSKYLKNSKSIDSDVDFSIKILKKDSFSSFNISKENYNIMTILVNKKINKINNENDILYYLNLLENLETLLNNRIMRIREWYSLHFPELNSIENSEEYLHKLMEIKNRETFENLKKDPKFDFLIKNSMGSSFTENDINHIFKDANDILTDIKKKAEFDDLIKEKCLKNYPNTSKLIDHILLAKMIRKAGSFYKLSEMPSSTIQILGSEKSYLQAMKQYKEKKVLKTPKYGFIFNSKIINKCNSRIKGKIARVLGNKLGMCTKVDVSKEDEEGKFGIKCKNEIYKRIAEIEEIGNKKAIKKKSKKIISVKEFKLK